MTMTRIAALTLVVAGGACGGGGSNGKSDAGRDRQADMVPANVVTGTVEETGPMVCVTADVKMSGGEYECTMVQHHATEAGVSNENVASCTANGLVPPCWILTNAGGCPGGELNFQVDTDLTGVNPADISFTYVCQI